MFIGLRRSALALAVLGIGGCEGAPEPVTEPAGESQELRLGQSMLAPLPNPAGFGRTASATGGIDLGNPFFQPLGTNGRSCGTCHQAAEGWSITPVGVRLRFKLTGGTDPLFKPHDVANAPNLDVSTVEARRRAYSLLLDRAVVRIGLPMKDSFEFVLDRAEDPHGWASATQLSLFRRPLPTTNLRFIGAINWDGRSTPAADPTNIRLGLKNQSNGATVNHAKAAAPISDAVREAIVDFETSITTAQIWDRLAFDLAAAGATGGPRPLLDQPFSIGMNSPGTAGFTRQVFTVFDAWQEQAAAGVPQRRREIADGQAIFNQRLFAVGPGFQGTCSGCHNTPNVGGASALRLFDVGVSAPERRRADVPLYTFRHKLTGATVQTTDPGRALITGLWADMNKFKVPGLRALAARAPYFHDGSAATLHDVVSHYDRRFAMQLSEAEKVSLVRFLESL